jgi:SAM-dependent methyltransferase
LLDAGYAVAAFEPAPSMVALAERRIRGRAPVATFRFEDLIDAVLRKGSGPARPIADASYDAVILGWESLSHVVDREMQADLFKCLDRICPNGPILASFWQRSGEAPAGLGKAERIGRSIGRTLMRLRGSRAATTDQVVFTTHAGFAYVFAEEEPRLLAERVGRTIASEANDEFPHVTFLKSG